MALVVTRHAMAKGLPLKSSELVADGKTQVKGLGRAAVQKILLAHDITKILASEGGRTSRGSVANMISYVEFLNSSVAAAKLAEAEAFWIDRVRDFFAAKPFKLKLDNNLSLRAVIQNVMAQAEESQKTAAGATIVGTVMQHMVGAKLDLVLENSVTHHGANQNDAGSGRHGDFDIGDVAIHVTATASEALIQKCIDNLSNGRKPIIVTTRKYVVVAEAQAEAAGIAHRVDVIDFEQFIATNIHELSQFAAEARRIKVGQLVERYNTLIEMHETNPSLKIEVAS